MKQSNLSNNETYKEGYTFKKTLINKNRRKHLINNAKINKKNEKNTLDYITKEVMKYIIKSNKNIINLKDITNSTKMTKRRLYDVTNVLEGKIYFYIFF